MDAAACQRAGDRRLLHLTGAQARNAVPTVQAKNAIRVFARYSRHFGGSLIANCCRWTSHILRISHTRVVQPEIFGSAAYPAESYLPGVIRLGTVLTIYCCWIISSQAPG